MKARYDTAPSPTPECWMSPEAMRQIKAAVARQRRQLQERRARRDAQALAQQKKGG